MNMSSPPLILVVGMHRSGTSLLGTILQAIDVALPGPLIAGDCHNPGGYFEREDITALQEELLIDLNRWWPSNEGLKPLPEHWLTSPRGQRAANCLKRILVSEQSIQIGPWAIKDPRSSLLLPLWRKVCQELGIPLKLLLAIRDPREVVISLIQRDGELAGVDVDHAAGLWVRHHHQIFQDGNDLPLHVIDYSRWFSDTANQLSGLASFCHKKVLSETTLLSAMSCVKPKYRRSKKNSSTVKIDRKVRSWYWHMHQTSLHRNSKALLRWTKHQKIKQFNTSTPHPWQNALTALGGTIPKDLQSWISSGIPKETMEQLEQLNHPGFPGHDPSALDGAELPSALNLELIGSNLDQWESHLWIDHLPLAQNTKLITKDDDDPEATLHVQPLAITAKHPSLLLKLSNRKRVFDPNPAQVRLLRLLGVNAEPLRKHPGGRWLKHMKSNVQSSDEILGLPDPTALGRLKIKFLCLGSTGESSWLHPPEGILQLPVFPPSPALSQNQARALAGWVATCLDVALPLVRLNPGTKELALWDHLQIHCLTDQISTQDLVDELDARKSNNQISPNINTPNPGIDLLWEHTTSQKPRAAICISSFNYANRLTKALISCVNQTLEAIELIVVDDASSDDSIDVIQDWLNNNGERFCRVQLLRHRENGGLASARNSGFAAAKAPWCWILDADNQIDPEALEHCLIIAEAASKSTAVVHPLIRILDDKDNPMGLVGLGHAWQKEQLRGGNMIDAMALIRRTAWLSVGGYSHIPGGWEDFDFWCKLIDDNQHGVLCPQVLATYRFHSDSMLQSQTNQRQRRLSRLLQARHPWLQLPYAQLDP